MEFEKTLAFLKEYAGEIEKAYKLKMDGKGYEISNDISVNVKIFGKGYQIVLDTQEYWRWIEGGRGSGKFPPPNVLIKWIQRRHIQPRGGISVKSLAYLIGRKISREGIPPKNYLRDSLNETMHFQEKLFKVFNLEINDLITKEMESWQSK